MTVFFAYLFGDSMAKVGLSTIADPERNGLNVFGYTLSGWTDVFIVFLRYVIYRYYTPWYCCIF
ncbi:hypothetical protein JPSP28_18200 [Staphylococcus pseudintermedius]